MPWYLLLLLLGLAVFGAMRSYARSTRPLNAPRCLLLWSLRAAAAGVILLCLSRPVVVQATTFRERGLCFLAVDSSSSMNLRDAPGQATRWEFAGRLLAEHQAELAELSRNFEIRRFRFDAAPSETSRLPGEEASQSAFRADGRATDLAGLLERVGVDSGGAPCAGVLLIGDGRQNVPRDPAPFAKALKAPGRHVPVYAVGVGAETPPADYRELQVKLLEVPERAFVRSQMLMHLEIESQLPKPERVKLTVKVDDEQIAEEELNLPEGKHLERVEVPYRPTALGMHRVVAALPVLPGEANVNNNQRLAYFRVYRTRLGIWYVEGTIRKEFGALRSALETAPNVSLHALNAFAAREGDADLLLPKRDEDWSELRLVILGDLPAKRFSSGALSRLARFVENGGSVLMLGGVQNLGPGSWHRTPLASVLPVEMNWTDGGFDGPLRISVTPDGQDHPALRLAEDPAASRELWGKLPPLPGVSGIGGVKPAAKVLLRAEEKTLLAVQEYGKGRSAVFTGDATWQWMLKAGQTDAHRRFWRGLATWLSRSDYRDADKAVFVESDRLQYLLGEEVELVAHVQETAALKGKLDDAKVVATLESGGERKRTWELGRGAGDFRARSSPPAPGSYTYRVELQDLAGGVLAKDELSFQVEVYDVENDNPRADLRLLRQLAELSGGQYFDAAQGGQAFKKLLQAPAGYAKTVREASELWNHWSVFMAFVGLLLSEWLLRKRWGLV
ncbi:MAG: glutamine amidotransferase [Planctomycetota bacterium]|nr:glutamine amidotransferase [Planctomycetota bacterium]